MKTYVCRLFGGRTIGVSYDPVAGTLSILGQSISIASLPATLQAEFAEAVGLATASDSASKPAFGGSNIGRAVGNILDNQPAWRSAVRSALAGYVAMQDSNGYFPDADSWRW